jgi:hypothetical protein
VDGYRHALRYGNYADFGFYDIGGAGAGEVRKTRILFLGEQHNE